MYRRFIASLLAVTCASALGAQQQSNPPASKARTVRIGVALPLNESRFLVSVEWARNQVIRSLKSLQTERKSSLTIEPALLESQMKADALEEAAEKHCDYVLLTRIENFSKTGGVFVGPGGPESVPAVIGNVDPRKEMAVDFTVMRPGRPNPIFEGRTAAPTDPPSTAAPSDNSTFEDAANQIALRVARELRKQKPQID
jgi:hypothetical protein